MALPNHQKAIIKGSSQAAAALAVARLTLRLRRELLADGAVLLVAARLEDADAQRHLRVRHHVDLRIPARADAVER